MRPKNKIRAIIFDVGGVLSLGRYEKKAVEGHHLLGVHNFMADKLGIDLDTWFDAIDSVYAKSIEGKINRRKTLYVMAKNLKCSVSKLEKFFLLAYKKHFKKNIELYKLAHDLIKKGYRVGILSDQWYLSKDALILQKDIRGFRPVIISCDVGLRKPNPKIYRLLLKKLRLTGERVLFIDNREWNLKPARALGIKTILFEDNEQLIKALIAKGIL
ncbi:HAD-IA family hydrolase [Candidatus Pacearchaeota archaeon]|nr:HAD-IA family hydrolase [Candidatus Pacearchaeota archaeon]